MAGPIVASVHWTGPVFVTSTCAIRLPAAPSHMVIRAASAAGAHDVVPTVGCAVGFGVGVGVATGVGDGDGDGLGLGLGDGVTIGVALGELDGWPPMSPVGPLPGRPSHTTAIDAPMTSRLAPARPAPARPPRTVARRGAESGRRA